MATIKLELSADVINTPQILPRRAFIPKKIIYSSHLLLLVITSSSHT
jgi:hypothetical protein